jgi:hypothetical protein
MLTTTGVVAVNVNVRATVARTGSEADTETGAETMATDGAAVGARTSVGVEVVTDTGTGTSLVGTTDVTTGAEADTATEATADAAVDTGATDAGVTTGTSGGGAPNAAGISARGRGPKSANRRLEATGAGIDVGTVCCRVEVSFPSSGMATAEVRGLKATRRQGAPGDVLPFLLAGSRE